MMSMVAIGTNHFALLFKQTTETANRQMDLQFYFFKKRKCMFFFFRQKVSCFFTRYVDQIFQIRLRVYPVFLQTAAQMQFCTMYQYPVVGRCYIQNLTDLVRTKPFHEFHNKNGSLQFLQFVFT